MPEQPEQLAVTAVGADRPGIIARVTGVLLELGGNLEDSSMTILGGHFAIMLLVRSSTGAEALESALREGTADLGLVVSVRPVGPGSESAPATHVLSVYGSDRPGIVHEVTSVLADLDVNVTDLTTRVIEGEKAVYAMMLELVLDDPDRADAVRRAVLDGVGEVDASLHALDVETF
jgi:glycine cleavage system transcriptional repressor